MNAETESRNPVAFAAMAGNLEATRPASNAGPTGRPGQDNYVDGNLCPSFASYFTKNKRTQTLASDRLAEMCNGARKYGEWRTTFLDMPSEERRPFREQRARHQGV
jgi:hypothetical protein